MSGVVEGRRRVVREKDEKESDGGDKSHEEDEDARGTTYSCVPGSF
jgi:hypothetical protein